MPNLVFASTNVTSGTGKAVVIATGMATQFGRIAEMTQLVDEDLSPLQKEMGFATRMVTVIACSIGIIFFVLAAVLVGVSLTESFIFAMGMVVAFVPEGMLPLVTLSLARSTQRMARRNALIKRLSAVETLGCTTVICTDNHRDTHAERDDRPGPVDRRMWPDRERCRVQTRRHDPGRRESRPRWMKIPGAAHSRGTL